ncbi:uncharacterized protein K452DRAFT_167927 [Aplosporella prunicola CBS 121167]|uniref:Protein ZIP4 homolog n=1 Tax=Aplosporella prunicola CBS 121167 TaxID=1176127 RepID=A0A6A6BGE5_9PEZI|nr:uncharacterized protein K452DRAFT_167927 [Aplosporella prunicola CBS 121167]KAF2143242.1 hypothetical protein K452DRAFT_167927 [Aplosporella prunicola CBS 121167]
MASKNRLVAENEKKVTGLIAFAQSLDKRVQNVINASSTPDPDLAPTLQTHIAALPLKPSSALAARVKTLDALGTALWNAATRARRTEAAPATARPALALLRVFAALLLDAACGSSGSGEHEARDLRVRVMRVSLKAAKACVEEGLLETCLRVLERAAFYEEVLGRERDPDVGEVVGRLRADYFALRMTLAWKQSKLHTADLFFGKVDLDPARLGAGTAEMLTDTFYEIGKDMLNKHRHEDAVKWLDRAYSVIGERDMEELGNDAVELRQSTMHHLIRALLRQDDHDAKEKAKVLLDLLALDHGDKMVVSLLQLEQLSAEPKPDPGQYYGAVERMMRSIHLTETNFKTIMHHVHKLKNLSPELAAKALDNFLDLRLFENRNSEWIEKVTVTHVWVSIANWDGDQSPEPLRELLDTVQQNMHGAFSVAATHAAQTLLWKRIESTYSQSQFNAAEAWCRLSLHPLFEKAGELNKAKVARKTILCALARHDYVTARKVYFDMSDAGKAAPMTRYLMYKVALRQDDPDLASECLDAVCKQTTQDVTLLYACVMEAQQAGNKSQAVVALQKVLEKYNYAAPQGVHLPALLRCMARLLLAELGTADNVNENVAEELVKLFEGAARQAKLQKRRTKEQSAPLFSEKELDWFSRNSYNISLKYCATLHPSHLLQLLEACIALISLFQEATTGDNEQSTAALPAPLTHRLLLTHYLAASTALVLARSADSIPVSHGAYHTLCHHADAFCERLPSFLRTSDLAELSVSARADLRAKRAQLLRYGLEAALKARDWDSMDRLFEDCFAYDTGTGATDSAAHVRDEDVPQFRHHLETLADLALVIHAEMAKEGPGSASASPTHRKRVLSVLQKIVNASWQRGGSGVVGADVVRLARWIRCLFQLSLDTDEETALQCMDHAIEVAGSPKKGRGSDNAAIAATAYPRDELEWLATTAFNRGVDAFCAGDDARCRMWAERALEVAARVSDGGALHKVLEEKYSGLRWES